MPIYTAASIAANRPTTTIFTAKGIPNLSPCILNSIVVMGTAGVYQEAYDEYRSQICAFLSATSLGRVVTTHQPAYDLGEPTPLFTTLPPVYIKPTVVLSDEEAELFMEATKSSAPVKETIGKSTVFYLNNASLEDAITASQGSDEKARARPGTITPENTLVAASLQTLITRFLQTQTYSAGEKKLETPAVSESGKGSESSDSEEEEEEEEFTETFVAHLEGGPVSGTAKVGGVKRKQDVDEWVATLKRKKLTVAEVEEFQEDFKEIWSEREVAIEIEKESNTFEVSRAKPSPFPVGFNRGGVRDVPNEPGVLFPFFSRMIIPDDQSLVAQFMATGFYKLLNTKLEGLGESLTEFLPRLRRLGGTDFGAAHSHMLLGVNLALQTQSRMFLIVQDGEYLGFTLHGSKFSVWVGPQKYKPRSAKDLSKEVSSLSSHVSAINELAEMFSEMKVISKGEPEEVKVEDLDSSSKIFEVMQQRVLDDVDEVEKQLRLLRFTDPFLPLDIVHIKNAFEALAIGDISSYTKKPKYLSAKYDFTRKESSVLSCFGPEFMSPTNQKGATYKLEELKKRSDEEYQKAMKKACGSKKERKEGEELPSEKAFKAHPTNLYKDPTDLPERIVLPKKPTPIAIKEWINFVSTKEIRMDPKERAALHRCITTNSKPVVASFWKATSLYAHSAEAGKRKSDDKGAGKKKKQKVSTSSGFLGLWGAKAPSSGEAGPSEKSGVDEFLDAMDADDD